MLAHVLSSTEETLNLEPIRSILPSLISDPSAWSVSPEATLLEARERMSANNIGALLVLSAQKLDGIISEENIREAIAEGTDDREARVNEVMTKGVYYVNPGTTINECMVLMESRRLRYVAVLDGDRVITMISSQQLNPSSNFRRRQ